MWAAKKLVAVHGAGNTEVVGSIPAGAMHLRIGLDDPRRSLPTQNTLWVCICKTGKPLVSAWNILLVKIVGTQAGEQSLHLPRPSGTWAISHRGTKGTATALKHCFRQAGLWVRNWVASHATHWAQRVRKEPIENNQNGENCLTQLQNPPVVWRSFSLFSCVITTLEKAKPAPLLGYMLSLLGFCNRTHSPDSQGATASRGSS